MVSPTRVPRGGDRRRFRRISDRHHRARAALPVHYSWPHAHLSTSRHLAHAGPFGLSTFQIRLLAMTTL